jgi:hypothetical protein
VPPDGLAVSVIDCPVSIAGAEGVIAFGTNAEFTDTTSAEEHCEIGEFAESFTWYV